MTGTLRAAANCPRSQATVVPILGMHRSGTSMFTRALNLLGLGLGEPLMKPQEDNPKGFWENEFFYNVDLRLLHAMQHHVSGYGTLEQLLRLPDLSQQIERSTEALGVIDAYVRDQFSACPVWGWKDPRSVLLFPFWLSSLVELGFRRIRPTVITRHPFSVVRSLTRRTDLTAVAGAVGCSVEDLALQMWTAYSHILLDIIEQTNCYISAHEWFLQKDSATAELLRCSQYLDMPITESGLTAATDWLDPGAVNHLNVDTPGGLTDTDAALLLHEDLLSRARAQRANWRLLQAA